MTPLLIPVRPTRDLGIRFMGSAADVAIGVTDPGSGNIFAGGITNTPGDGDFVIMAAVESASLPATPSGWTSLATVSETAGSFDSYMRISYKVLTGAWAGVTSGVNGGGWAISAWRGVDQTTPIDVTTTTATHASTIVADPPSITPSTAGAVIVVFGHGAQNAAPGFTNWSPLSGAAGDAGLGGGQGVVTATAYYDGWTSGAYDPAAYTISGEGAGSRGAVSASVVLRPAS